MVQVAATPMTPDICLVTVDSLSQNNLIVWDKTQYVSGDTFLIYRDTANNAYGLIGKVPFDSLSLFTDTVRTLYAADGNPNVTSWRYKIAVQDTCGNISAKSLYHQSIYIQNSSGNFSWNDYKIEGQSIPVPALTNYIFQRDNLSNGNYQTIQTLSASSTSYTDLNYSSYAATATWRVKTVWSISCNATIMNPKNPNVFAVNLNSSKSNAFKGNINTAVNSFANDNLIDVSPNPSSGNFIVRSLSKIPLVEIYNVIGEKIETQIGESNQIQINISGNPAGIYFLQVKTEKGIINRKIILTK
jgi:hypothetical protein